VTREIAIDAAGGAVVAALLVDGRPTDILAEPRAAPGVTGAVWLGRVRRIDRQAGAVFVDLGLARDGFLNIAAAERGSGPAPAEGRPMLVQATGEPREAKGPPLTRDIALPGRWLVHVPLSPGVAVARRLGEAARRAWRERLGAVADGWIVRTAGAGAAPDAVLAEAERLHAEWQALSRAAAAAAPDAPVPLRPAPGVAERMILDAPDAAAIRVGDADLHRALAARLRRALPDLAARLAREPVDVVEWLPPLLAPEVALPSGGRLTVEQTRALTAIDVDTGAARSALPTDLEAAAEAARQLRLRNIGGLVVIDFVSEAPAARSQVLDRLRAALKGDPAQVRLGGATALGLVELARERRGFGLAEATRSGGGL